MAKMFFICLYIVKASQDELRDYFGHFGHVKDARIITDTRGNSKGFGFVTYDSENDASKVLSLKEEDLIFKENKLNIGHAFRKKNNFDQGQGGGQYQQGMRGQNGMGGGQGQHHMMGGNMGGLGLGNFNNLFYFKDVTFSNLLIALNYSQFIGDIFLSKTICSKFDPNSLK